MPAGHDRFDGGLIEEHLGPLRDQLGISFQQLMGLGRVEPHNEGETFCMTVLGLKLSRRANAVSCAARPRQPADVGPSLAVARRGRDSDRPYHQRRAYPELARLADAAALRSHLPRRLDAPRDGRAGYVARDIQSRSGRIVGDTLQPEKPAAAIRAAARQPAMPPPRARATRPSNWPATFSIPMC